jgi:hypothetical protein
MANRIHGQWICTSRPVVFKRNAFSHPQEFLTAFLHTPRGSVADGRPEKPPDVGIAVENLYIERRSWTPSHTLTECGQREQISTLPILHLIRTGK